MTDIERIIATIKDYQDKNLSLEDLQSYFQTLPLCLYFSAQQIEELEEQLETIRFLISDEMQHETVIHYLKPMKNYLESLRSSKMVFFQAIWLKLALVSLTACGISIISYHLDHGLGTLVNRHSR